MVTQDRHILSLEPRHRTAYRSVNYRSSMLIREANRPDRSW